MTDAGPPEKMMPFGLEPLERLVGGVERRDLGIDAGLADAARDQLRHLAAEVDDEDGFSGLDRHGGRIESARPRVKLARKEMRRSPCEPRRIVLRFRAAA